MALQTPPYLPSKEGPQLGLSQGWQDSEGFSGYSLKQPVEN